MMRSQSKALKVKRWLGLMLAPWLAWLSACQTTALHELQGSTMGTTWSVRWTGPLDKPSAAKLIEAELSRLNTVLSAWREDSDLSRINRSPSGDWQPAPAELLTVLGEQLTLARSTEGRYDPTIAPLLRLWGFGHGSKSREVLQPPSAAEIDAARARVGYQKLKIDLSRGRLRKPPGVELDVASGGPGFAVDRLAALLQAQGVDDYLIELGGELRARGYHPSGRPWQVAIEDPAGGDRLQLIVALQDAALGASGDYRDFQLDANGQPHSHFVDPLSGTLIAQPPAQVTVVATSCLQADASATALTVMGLQHGLAYANANGIAARFVVRGAGGYRVHHSAAFDRWLTQHAATL